MTISKAHTNWQGPLSSGSGVVGLDSSRTAEFAVNWKARAEGNQPVTTPEELIAAAHSSCFSMALSHALEEDGLTPTQISCAAAVTFKPGVGITSSHLTVSAVVPGLSEDDFARYAANAKAGCPVSAALSGIEITLDATLVTE